jgi:hypothetical protein
MRYVASTRPPRADDWDGYPDEHRTMSIIEDTDAPQAPGLLDAAGVPIYRVADRNPIGFRGA